MASSTFTKRKIVVSIFRFFFCSSLVSAQVQNDLPWFHGEAGTSYFNIVKQKSPNSTATIFFRESFARLAYGTSDDSIDVSVSSSRLYGNYGHPGSSWSVSLQNDVNMISAGWNSRFSFLEYHIGANALIQSLKVVPGFSLRLTAKPVGDFFSVGGEYVRTNEAIHSTLEFHDFFVPFGQQRSNNRFTFFVGIQSVEKFRLGFSSFTQSERFPSTSDEYTADFSNTTTGNSFSFVVQPIRSIALFGTFTIAEERPDVVLNRDALSFGSFPAGEYSLYSIDAGVHAKIFSLPASMRYRRNEFRLKGAGVVESWPFTSLAASVIANRLVFTLNGTMTVQNLGIAADVLSSFGLIRPEIGYCVLQPEYTLKHWQPEFLVFGAKAMAYESSSINALHLIELALGCTIPLFGGRLELSALQFIPVAIQYETHPSKQGETVIEVKRDAKTNSVDGGRFVQIRFAW